MGIELVGLAYDERQADTIWSEVPLREAYDAILEDEFRRKVDPRSLRYHKGQIDLLLELERFLKQGGGRVSAVELIAARFRAGVEEFPTPTGELAFDFKLVRHFVSLAMVDDFLVADPFLRALLKKVSFLKNGTPWSLVETRDYDGVVAALRDVRIKDISDVSHAIRVSEEPVSFENLVRNYIEFLSYARNNRLTPFFYNSEADFRHWGNLAERKNRRNEFVVDLSMKPRRRVAEGVGASRALRREGAAIQDRFKLRREIDSLLGGLRDTDPLIRQKSAESLGRIAQPEALPHLIGALTDEEPEVRQEIVRAIDVTGDPRGLEILVHVARND